MIHRHPRRWMAAMLFCVLVAPGLLSHPVVVVDDRGMDIVLDVAPRRIIAIGSLYAQLLVDLNAADRLVAVADSPDNPSEVDGIASVGPSFAPSVEVMASLRPDLVLGATDWGGERPALEALGITVLTTPMLTSIADILDTVRLIGMAIGESERAMASCAQIESAVAAVGDRVAALPPVRAAFLYPPSLGVAPYVAGKGSIEGELLERAGAVNVFVDVDGFPQVGVEEILVRDPEVIFASPSQVAYVTDDPLLQTLTAVRTGRVFGISAGRAASTAVGDVLEELANLLHPE